MVVWTLNKHITGSPTPPPGWAETVLDLVLPKCSNVVAGESLVVAGDDVAAKQGSEVRTVSSSFVSPSLSLSKTRTTTMNNFDPICCCCWCSVTARGNYHCYKFSFCQKFLFRKVVYRYFRRTRQRVKVHFCDLHCNEFSKGLQGSFSKEKFLSCARTRNPN